MCFYFIIFIFYIIFIQIINCNQTIKHIEIIKTILLEMPKSNFVINGKSAQLLQIDLLLVEEQK